MKVRVIVTASCTHRSGVAKQSGNPYTMAEAYVVLPGVEFPQKFDYYCTDVKEVLRQGEYECDVTGSIKDNRVHFEFDPRQGRVVNPAGKPAVAAAS